MTNEQLCDTLLVGVCGSIHALSLHTYLALFRESLAAEIKVIMTASAGRMISADAVSLYTNEPVFSDVWDRTSSVDHAPHIQLTRWADLFVVVPATANILGKAANGVADDLLSTAILSSPKRVIFAPAMNPAMWDSPAVRRNIETLKADGHYLVPPEPATSLTSGEQDLGLAPSPQGLLRHLRHVRMKNLKNEYWEEATSEPALTPAQKKLQSLIASASAGEASR